MENYSLGNHNKIFKLQNNWHYYLVLYYVEHFKKW